MGLDKFLVNNGLKKKFHLHTYCLVEHRNQSYLILRAGARRRRVQQQNLGLSILFLDTVLMGHVHAQAPGAAHAI